MSHAHISGCGDFLQSVDFTRVVQERFALEQWLAECHKAFAPVIILELRLRRHRSSKQTVSQRTLGHDAHYILAAKWHDLSFRPEIEQEVADLVCHYFVFVSALFHHVWREVADSALLDFALAS